MMTESAPCNIITRIILNTIPLRPPVERTTFPLKMSSRKVAVVGVTGLMTCTVEGLNDMATDIWSRDRLATLNQHVLVNVYT